VLTGFSSNFSSFCACQFFKGLGIGGEYSAMNSAINELIPARVRGWVDLAVNGSYWMGAVLASAFSLVMLDTTKVPIDIGWRLPFGLGGFLGIFIIASRIIFIPESPRWLITHDRLAEAEHIVSNIEHTISPNVKLLEIAETISVNKKIGTFKEIIQSMMTRKYRK